MRCTMLRPTLPTALAALALASNLATQAAPQFALKGLDPVALCRGEELAGRDDLTFYQGRFRYRFADAENAAVFGKDPERYCIQLGGGCGRMGPLSGVGDPERFAVHDGHIYIFASDSCRKGFLAAPEDHLELPDPIAEGSAEQATRADELLDRAVTAAGGAETLRAIRTLHLRVDREQEHQGRKIATGEALVLGAGASIRSDSWWDGYTNMLVTVDTRLGFGREREDADADPITWNLAPAQILALRKIALREPTALLALRGRRGFVAFAGAERELDGHTVVDLTTSFAGVTTTWSIDPKSGHILAASYRGRLGMSPLGAVTMQFSDFREVDGITLPFVRTARFGERDAQTRTWTSVAVNAAADRDAFRR